MTIKLKLGCSGRERDFQESRPWWEPPYLIYGFSNPRVRSRMERLMKSYVVRATDYKYMIELQRRSRQDHEEALRKRITDREVAEVEREKRLILEGKMPIEEAPEELSNHPVFKTTQLAMKIIEKNKKKSDKNRRHKKFKRFDYDLLKGMEEEEVEDTEITSCIDMEESETDRARKLEECEQYLAEGEAFSNEDYLRIKYDDALVEELQEIETVDELYQLADEIVGPLIGKRCGGLVK